MSPTSGEAGEVTLTVTTQPNDMPQERSASISIEAGDIEKSITVTQAAALHPANNMIWYTSTDGDVVNPDNPNAFGAAIVSNTYENGTGVIIFDGDVTAVGKTAFYQCSTLLEITLPNSITSIGDWAFSGCINLLTPTILDSVTYIGKSAFQWCSSLQSVTIPSYVTAIGMYAFRGCDLQSVYCKPITPPVGDPLIFHDNSEHCIIYVPTESVETYKTAAGWSDYAEAIVGYNF